MPDIQTAPTQPVNSSNTEALANAGQVHDLSFYGMFMQADWVVKAVILILVIASIWCWKIILDKWLTFSSTRTKMKKFEKRFWSSNNLKHVYDEVYEKPRNPLARIFVAGMGEWIQAKEGKLETTQDGLAFRGDERVHLAMEQVKADEIGKLEKSLGFLATVGSTAPFIGLFGTVWGIMNSFQSIANSQNTSLAVVAPGIAEALFATAIGLLAAIPAVIFYNKFVRQTDVLAGDIEEYTNSLNTLLKV